MRERSVEKSKLYRASRRMLLSAWNTRRHPWMSNRRWGEIPLGPPNPVSPPKPSRAAPLFVGLQKRFNQPLLPSPGQHRSQMLTTLVFGATGISAFAFDCTIMHSVKKLSNLRSPDTFNWNFLVPFFPFTQSRVSPCWEGRLTLRVVRVTRRRRAWERRGRRF